MTCVLIMQARMGSTRLPGKVMRELLPGRTMLDLTLERVKRCRRVDRIVVAVPDSAENDAVAAEAGRCQVEVFRGPEDDVLARYVGAARAAAADIVVRVTSDNPLSDPQIIDLHVERMKEGWGRFDFVANTMQKSYPTGLAVEVVPMDVLERMHRMSDTPYLREHVLTLAYERPELFVIDHVRIDRDLSDLRWTVDHAADFEFARRVFEQLYDEGNVFLMDDVLRLASP